MDDEFVKSASLGFDGGATSNESNIEDAAGALFADAVDGAVVY